MSISGGDISDCGFARASKNSLFSAITTDRDRSGAATAFGF
jgi:hypothetical protein